MSELSPTKYVSELVPGRETSLLLRLSTPEPQLSSGSQKSLQQFESTRDIEEFDSGLFSNNHTPEKDFDSGSIEQQQKPTSKQQAQKDESLSKKKDSKGKDARPEPEAEPTKVPFIHPTCPLPGCNSAGHSKGDYRHHRRVASCPNMKQVQAYFMDRLDYGGADPNDFFQNLNPSELY